MPQPLSERTASFTDSVIRRMTRVSLKYGAVNLSQGFPDFDPPQAILERLAQVAREGPHQYSVTWGAQNFREALARKQSRYMGRTIDPDKEIVATCGSTEAMMCAMMTVTNPGDKVIVFSPFYENYGADTILSGAEPIYVPLHLPAFTFDVDELEAAFRQRPKALVLCNPSNPCGRVFTREELLTIAEMATKYDTYVITDEVYEHIVYAPHRHTYFATLPGMWNRTLSCSSLSKTYSITGWRLGYIIAPEEIIDRAAARLDAENVRFEDVLTKLDQQRQEMERERTEARRLKLEMEQFARFTLEKEILNRIRGRLTAEQEAAYRLNLESYRQLERDPDAENRETRMLDLDNAFHRRAFELCGMEEHFDHMLSTFQHIERLRKFSLQTEENKSVCAAHTRILEAVLRGSEEDLSRALSDHLNRYKLSVEQARQRHPEYFTEGTVRPVDYHI